MSDKLLRSFGTFYSLLERPKAARLVVFGLLAIHTGLLAYSAYVHSPTLNEPGHLVAGLSHWKFGRFEVYRVNPPLVKMIAALPVMAVGYEEDWSSFYEGLGARPEMAMGEDFVAANGERSFFLFMIARWACIPLSWIGALTCYLWARDLYGRPSGVMACAIWCFEPNILAHASLMTPDIGGTALGVAACYTFWKWLKKPTWAQAALTGVVLGLAELCKTTLILFYPLWPILWVIYRWRDRASMIAADWLREAGMLALRMAIGLYILNLGYGFEGSFTQLKNYGFVSSLLAGDSANNEWDLLRNSPNEDQVSGKFAKGWLGELPIPLPKDYLLGIDTQQRDFEVCIVPSYLNGKWNSDGWVYYYLYAALLKLPVGILVICIITCFTAFKQQTILTKERYLQDTIILLALPIIIFVVVSSKHSFSEHFRYVLPCAPFIFVWIAGPVTSFFKEHQSSVNHKKWQMSMAIKMPFVVVTLLLWSILSSLCIYPHSLSYFNEIAGGPSGGHRYLLGSNFDWGQDLKYLSLWLKENKSYGPVCVAYYGGIQPSDADIRGIADWEHALSRPVTGSEDRSRTSYHAISSNLYHGLPAPARGVSSDKRILAHADLASVREKQPVGAIGYTIFLFRNN